MCESCNKIIKLCNTLNLKITQLYNILIHIKNKNMKSTNYLLLVSAIVFSMLFTSCGPGKKLVASRVRVSNLEQDSTTTHKQLNECNGQVTNLNAQKEALQNQRTALQDQNASVHNDLNTLSSSSKMTIADQATRLRNLQNIIQAQKDVLSKLKNSISDALMKYKTDELSVSIKDGSVYVSLQEKLLFKSGSDVVDAKGVAALKSLALVLNSTKDINVLIQGHTDNVPIKTMLFKDNWDLSTARATAIVRILTNGNGFDSRRITSSGRSEFLPVNSNDTPEGRAGNRRTEVILSPDLNELYKMLNQ